MPERAFQKLGDLLAVPFASRMLVQQDAEGWRIKAFESSEGHLNWTIGRGTVTPDGQFETQTEGGIGAKT